jgi:Retinal pigment epithelial membrane protein
MVHGIWSETVRLVDMALLGSDPDPGWPFRLDPFINVVCHAGRYLALEEGTPPYELTPQLETVGLYDFAGVLPAGICAHPRIDPVTDEMILFRYDVEEPYLTWVHDPRLRHHRAPRRPGHRPGGSTSKPC